MATKCHVVALSKPKRSQARSTSSLLARTSSSLTSCRCCDLLHIDVQSSAFGLKSMPPAEDEHDDARGGGGRPQPYHLVDEDERSRQAAEVSDLVAAVLVSVEELRQDLAALAASTRPRTSHVLRWRDEAELLVGRPLALLQQYAIQAVQSSGGPSSASASSTTELWRHCRTKVRDLLHQVLQASFQLQEADDEDGVLAGGIPPEELRQDSQGAIARLAELLLTLVVTSQPVAADAPEPTSSPAEVASASTTTPDEVVRLYAMYQRSVIRQRAKPPIAQLVQERNLYQRQRQSPTLPLYGAVHPDDDDAEVDGGVAVGPNRRPPSHSATVAHVLGQAAVLIHPLLVWKSHLPPNRPVGPGGTPPLGADPLTTALHQLCEQASVMIDEQAQNMVQTVFNWLQEDWELESWLQRTNDDAGGTAPALSRPNLTLLDGLVEEWAFVCQACSRYLALTQRLRDDDFVTIAASSSSEPKPTNGASSPSLSSLLPEWTWKYGALERYLAIQNWRAALSQAQPTTIVLGTMIRVPSVVEDAQYLSLRALQRASDTQSALAVGTVAHAVSRDVWSADPSTTLEENDHDNGGGGGGGVHATVRDALERRIGCFPARDDGPRGGPHAAPSGMSDGTSAAPKSGDFAAALLSALDDEDEPHGGALVPTRPPRRKPPSAPASGNFLALMGGNALNDEATFQRRLDAEFCALNGIHAAAGACRGLASFLDSLLSLDAEADDDALLKDDKAVAMIQLAGEELLRHAISYDRTLESQIHSHIETYSAVFLLLQRFFQEEEYRLTTETIAVAESDDRLEREMMGPLHESRFLNQLSNKLESEVCQKMGESIIGTIVQLILDVLWDSHSPNDESRPKPFTDLGALLLSKQVRLLQGFVARAVSDPNGAPTVPNLSLWERLSQVLTAVQLEKPSDWLAYYQTSSVLSPDELGTTLRLRVDFSPDAIQAIVKKVTAMAVEDPKSRS